MNCSKGARSSQETRSAASKRTYLPILPTPSYAQLSSSTTLEFPCNICNDYHSLKDICKIKPPFPPSTYFPRCDICLGYHPRGQCYFEYIRTTLFTHSFCEYCNIAHIGFCNDTLLCQICNTRHNFADGCTRQTRIDLSDNLCPHCEGYHFLHCPSDLLRLENDTILWCNRCKIAHSFMNCVPFCNRCLRRHREGPCPESWTFCEPCNYCHQGDLCPNTDDERRKKQEELRWKENQEAIRRLDFEAREAAKNTASLSNRQLSSTVFDLEQFLSK